MCPTDILEKHLSGRGDSTDKVPKARVWWASWIKRKEAKSDWGRASNWTVRDEGKQSQRWLGFRRTLGLVLSEMGGFWLRAERCHQIRWRRPLQGYTRGMVGFSGSSAGKESACNAGDPGSIPESERSAGEGVGYPLQYSWASVVTQLIKNLPAMWETWVRSLGWENPMEKGKATHSSILA